MKLNTAAKNAGEIEIQKIVADQIQVLIRNLISISRQESCFTHLLQDQYSQRVYSYRTCTFLIE